MIKLKNKSEPPAVPSPVPRERKEPEKKPEVVVAIYDFSGAEQGDLSLIKVCLQLFRERLSEKSAKVHATIPKGTVGIFREF